MNNKISHYYGDTVRSLFIVCALIMVIGLPWVSEFLTLPPFYSILAMLILIVTAGLLNPKQRWTFFLATVIALASFIIFESSAIIAFTQYTATSKFFLFNQLLAFIFLFAQYYSVKTIRGSFVENNRIPPYEWKGPNPPGNF